MEKTIGFVRDVAIVVNEENELVPIKPICEALGIAANGQIELIKNDPILGSTSKLSLSVGKDGKQREMFCIPIKYSFGWLLKIDSRNVKEEAKEALLNYQRQCYDVLYNYFTAYMRYVKDRQVIIDKKMDVWHSARVNFKNTQNVMNKAWAEYTNAKKLTFDDYENAGMQFDLFDYEEAEDFKTEQQ